MDTAPMRMLASIIAVTSWSAARADDAPPAPTRDVGGYAEAAIGAGRAIDGSTWAVQPHHGAGFLIRWPEALHLRFGLAVDLFRTRPRDSFARWESSLGVETQVDWPVASGWRVGGHAALLSGLTRDQDDTLVTAGIHGRYDRWLLRVDAIVPIDSSERTLIVVGAGFSGRPAIVTMAATLLGALVVATLEGISS